jgi:putative DNA primase/helicase
MNARAISLTDISARFREAMHAAGVPIDDDLNLSGALTRFRVPGDRKSRKDGWYQAHADGNPTVCFGWWGHVDTQVFSLRDPASLNPEEREAYTKRIEETRRQREAENTRRRIAAAGKAVALWSKAVAATPAHAYLSRKGVQPHGLRVAVWCKWVQDEKGQWQERRYPDALLVPLYNAAGELRNLQAILPGKDFPGERDKDFLPGVEKVECFHLLGTPESGRPLLVCEGFATGASLHECTGHAVALAFDCGNLKSVALALNAKYPEVVLLIAGDNDSGTQGNPGATKSREAAEATGARWCVPDFSTLANVGKVTDFNDLHALAGVDAVISQITAALQASPSPVPKQSAAPTRAQTPVPARFSLNPPGLPDGLYFTELDREGNAKAPRWIAAPLDIPALTRAPDGTGWGCLCVFDDPDHVTHRIIIAAEKLRGDGLEALGMLLDQGLRVSPAGKRLLVEYLQTASPNGRARVSRRTGWQDTKDGGRVFLLPSGAIGSGGEEWIYEGNAEHYRIAGTRAEWRQHVGSLCSGNSRLVFSVAVAFAAPLMRLASTESGGGFHWRGDSSLGKSLLLELCASVIGSPERVPKWNATGVGLEGLAAAYCDAALPLDEIKMVDPKQAATSAYLLTSGQDKARGKAEGGLRARLSWRGLILSSGEISLGQHVQEAGGKNYAGQDVRLCDLPAVASSSLGVFDSLHDSATSKALHDRLSRAVRKYHGAIFPAWLEIVAKADAVELAAFVRNMTERFELQFLTDAASGQARRVATRFALIAAAGELATRHNLTGWEAGETLKATGRLFREWLAVRGGEGRSEDRDMLRQVRLFLEEHGDGRFTEWYRITDDHAPKTLKRAGYRRITTETENKSSEEQRTEYFILPEVWRTEVCRGFDPTAVARVMLTQGYIRKGTEAARPWQIKEQVPGAGRVRLIHVLPSFLEADHD